VPLLAASTATALPGLPPGYNVTRIDSPLPVSNAGFGNTNAPIPSVNGSGHEDLAVAQYTGSLNGDGILWEIDPVTGKVINFTNAPVPSSVSGQVTKDGADTFLERYGDIGSCPAPITPTANNPGPICPSPVMGPPDGVPDILWGLGDVPVKAGDGTYIPNVGEVYIIDGKTMNVLKILDMPVADINQIEAVQAEYPAATGTEPILRGGFGRTAAVPWGLPACAGNDGVAACPTTPAAVANGDLFGSGFPSIIVGANMFPDTAGTSGSSNPVSQCYNSGLPATTMCIGSGRTYVYNAGLIAGTSPATPDNTPQMTIKDPAAQVPFPNTTSVGDQVSNFGHAQFPIGDVGACQQGAGFVPVTPGAMCPLVDRTNTPDGVPDYIVSAHRAFTPIWNPDPANYEEGASFLIDGKTGSILQVYTDPSPQPDSLFGFTTGQQFPAGNLGDTPLPDVILASWNDDGGQTEAGVGWVFSGNVASNTPNFARIDDPQPKEMERFANPVEGVGQLVGAPAVANDVLAGEFSNVPTTGMAGGYTTVNFMDPANNQSLQTIQDPDNQQGSGFGMHVIPLGNLDGSGQLSFAASSPRWAAPATATTPAVLGQGRIYVFTPNPNAVVPPPPSTTGPQGPQGPPGSTTVVTLAGRTLDLDASSTAVKHGGSVTLRGVLAAFADPSTCQAGQSVQLQDRAPGGTAFTTFATVKTNAAGVFKSGTIKPKATELFRARIGQTSACLGAQSDRVTVQVGAGKSTKKKRSSTGRRRTARHPAS
jgi:hypothetical protein